MFATAALCVCCAPCCDCNCIILPFYGACTTCSAIIIAVMCGDALMCRIATSKRNAHLRMAVESNEFNGFGIKQCCTCAVSSSVHRFTFYRFYMVYSGRGFRWCVVATFRSHSAQASLGIIEYFIVDRTFHELILCVCNTLPINCTQNKSIAIFFWILLTVKI